MGTGTIRAFLIRLASSPLRHRELLAIQCQRMLQAIRHRYHYYYYYSEKKKKKKRDAGLH